MRVWEVLQSTGVDDLNIDKIVNINNKDYDMTPELNIIYIATQLNMVSNDDSSHKWYLQEMFERYPAEFSYSDEESIDEKRYIDSLVEDVIDVSIKINNDNKTFKFYFTTYEDN